MDETMSTEKVDAGLLRPPRLGVIELLQVVSLLVLALFWLLFEESEYRALGSGAAIVLGLVIPFLLVRPRKPAESEDLVPQGEEAPDRKE